MPVLCGACGSENRENAKFCIGCARRLPGFVATGPSALETLNQAHPRAPARSARVWRRDDPLALLPAETAGFWLRLALLGLAMGIGFIGWYLYVTRQLADPPFLNQVTAALTLEDRKPASDEPPTAPAAPSTTTTSSSATTPSQASSVPAPAAPAAPGPSRRESAKAAAPAAATPEKQAALAKSAAPEKSAPPSPAAARTEPPAAAPAPRTASAAAPERKRDEPPPVVRQPRTAAWSDPEPPVAAAPATPWIRPPGWTRDDPGTPIGRRPVPVEATPRATASIRGDGGPPIAPGPGPVYNFSSPGSSSSGRDDPGPPIAPGPGPLYESARTPNWAANDAGPPIAVGPGPVYNRTRDR